MYKIKEAKEKEKRKPTKQENSKKLKTNATINFSNGDNINQVFEAVSSSNELDQPYEPTPDIKGFRF